MFASRKKFPYILLALTLSSGCTHALHQYHAGDAIKISKKKYKSKTVSAETKQKVILGFVSDTNYVNQAFAQLQDQCAKGKITGIHTRYSTSHGFLSWTNKIKMTGTCYKKR